MQLSFPSSISWHTSFQSFICFFFSHICVVYKCQISESLSTEILVLYLTLTGYEWWKQQVLYDLFALCLLSCLVTILWENLICSCSCFCIGIYSNTIILLHSPYDSSTVCVTEYLCLSQNLSVCVINVYQSFPSAPSSRLYQVAQQFTAVRNISNWYLPTFIFNNS